jgi:cytosine-specific methyltransferase
LFLSVKKLQSFVTASFGTVTIGTTRKMNSNQIKNFGFPKSKEISPEITRLMKHSKIQASKEGVSFTLKANMGTWKNRVPYIKDSFGIRKITPCECLALLGFPEEFCFPNIITIDDAYKQTGNSVCVPIIKRIADQIKIHLISEIN